MRHQEFFFFFFTAPVALRPAASSSAVRVLYLYEGKDIISMVKRDQARKKKTWFELLHYDYYKWEKQWEKLLFYD